MRFRRNGDEIGRLRKVQDLKAPPRCTIWYNVAVKGALSPEDLIKMHVKILHGFFCFFASGLGKGTVCYLLQSLAQVWEVGNA